MQNNKRHYSQLVGIPLTNNERVDRWIANIDRFLYDIERTAPRVLSHRNVNSFSIHYPFVGEPDGWMEWEESGREALGEFLRHMPSHVPARVIRRIENEIAITFEHPVARHIRIHGDEMIARDKEVRERKSLRLSGGRDASPTSSVGDALVRL